MKNFHIYTFLLYLIVVTNHNVISQDERSTFKQLSISQGLPGVTVQRILQDRFGIMWFGIESYGLCRYDGHSFIVYKNRINDPTSISNDFVTSFCEDSTGNLWIGTRSGLNYFNRKEERFIRYLHDPNDPNTIAHDHIHDVKLDNEGFVWLASDNGINLFDPRKETFKHFSLQNGNSGTVVRALCLYIDKFNNVWAGTRSDGLFKISKQVITEDIKKDIKYTIENWKHNNKPNSLTTNNIWEIIPGDNGVLWLGTVFGIEKYYIKENKFVKHDFIKNGKKQSLDYIYVTLFKDDKGMIWAGSTNNGLVIFNPDSQDYIHLLDDPYYPKGLRGNSIRSIYRDHTGLIWVGTKFEGLNIYDKRQEMFSLIHQKTPYTDGLSTTDVTCIKQDKNGILWIGCRTGGLNKYNKTTGEFKHYMMDDSNPYSIHSNRVEDIEEDESGLWLATDNGIEYFNIHKEVFFKYGYGNINSICRDRNNQLWLGSLNGIYKFDVTSKKMIKHTSHHYLFSNENETIYRVMLDLKGNLWFATYNNGVYEYIPDRDSLNHFKHDPFDSNSISGNNVRAIFEDKNGTIWLGTLSDGLNMYDREDVIFRHIKMKEGLPSNTVYDILEDKAGNLWLTTHNGISRLDPELLQFDNYNIEYGLQGKIFNLKAAWKTNDGEMYMGGFNGVNHFYPDKIFKKIDTVPIIISTIRVFDKIIARDISGQQEFCLDRKDNCLYIEFSLLDFSDPSKNQYAYKLDGFDEDWIVAGNRNFVSYTSLPPGEYTFMAKGSNIDKVTIEDEIGIRFIIPVPFWLKRWFYLSLFLGFVLLIFLVYYLRMRAERKKQIVLKKEVANKSQKLMDAYALLKEQKQEIEDRSEELLIQRNQIEYQNRELEQHRTLLEYLVKKRTKELEQAKMKAEQSDMLKSAFLANMSHEIKTPLNAIVGFSEILATEELTDEEVMNYNQIIQDNSLSLLKVIGDIVDISKIESGQIEIKETEIILGQLLQHIYVNYLKIVEKNNKDKKKDIKLIYNEKKTSFDIRLITDAGRLKQVFDNLLSNAIKFTDKGWIEIGYVFMKEQEKARIYIKDTGIGIEKENLSSIFERFNQIEVDPDSTFQGTGLGLSITKNLVELLGGKIWAESEVEKGTQVYFELPVKAVEGSSGRDIEESHHDQKLKPDWSKVNVLVVEDEESNYQVVETMMKQTKVNILWAKDGEEGISKFKKNQDKINIVLLDIEIPKLKGTEVIKHLKELRSDIPIIAQTAYAMQEDESEFLSIGFDAYIAKPFTQDTLLSVISRLLSQSDQSDTGTSAIK